MATWKKVLTEAQIDTDGTFGSPVDTLVPSQAAVKTYVDAQVDTADTLAELTDVELSGVSDAHVLVYDSPEYTTVALSGDATINTSGVLTIGADKVTYAKMQNVSATDRILGRDSSGAGVVEEIAPAALRTMINVEDAADVTDKTNVSTALASLTGSDTLNIGDSGNDSTVNIRGNLTVSGTTTTVNTTNLDVADAVILLADNASPTPDTGDGAGIQVDTHGTASARPQITWKKDIGASNDGTYDGTGTANGLTGWKVRNHQASNQALFSIAIMDYKDDTGAPSGNSAGIGSLLFNTHDDELYLRTA